MLIVIVIMTGISILSASISSVSLADVFGLVTNPMKSNLNELTAQEQLKYDGLSREELENYSNELLKENTALKEQLISYYDLQRQNELYKQALELKEDRVDFNIVPATVLAKDIVLNSVSIDVGSSNGIEVGDLAITQEGVFGIVSSVTTSSATVDSILSEKVSIGAISEELLESGVISSTPELSLSGLVRLEYLSKSTKIDEGTIISTSGASEVFPDKILIGEVLYLETDKETSQINAIVKPYADIEIVSELFIITDFEVGFEVTEKEDDTDEVSSQQETSQQDN